MLESILVLPRVVKRIIALLFDAASILLLYWFCYWIRLGEEVEIHSIAQWMVVTAVILLTLALLMRLGLYKVVVRYAGARMVWLCFIGAVFSTAALILISYYSKLMMPRTVPVLFFPLMLITLAGGRSLMRFLLTQGGEQKYPVLIYGAGVSGRHLHLSMGQGAQYYVVAFIDDDHKLHGVEIQGLTVYSRTEMDSLVTSHKIHKVLLALPSASKAQRKAIIERLEHLGCEVLSVPSTAELLSGSAAIDELKEVSVDELLGRDAVAPIPELLSANIQDKTVMVTGAAGSIGSELCRQILRLKPERLLLFDLSEFGLYSLEKELEQLKAREQLDVLLLPFLGSVQNQSYLQTLMREFSVDTVYHAAAYKHVPLVEYNLIEGIRNNVFGTQSCALAALQAGVKRFVLISSDKAVRPTNFMGVTKRLAELVLQNLAVTKPKTCFCMVRFGNVLDSSGSVVPLFRRQIDEGGPVTVTHPEIIRYFMTIPEASQLVIQAGAMGRGGELFVLDMGRAVKILDLAKRMIHLSGLQVRDGEHPQGDIEIQFTGLRPGEKLYEELLIGRSVCGTRHPKIMSAQEQKMGDQELLKLLSELDRACESLDHQRIRELLLSAPTGFEPSDELCDLLWRLRQDSKQQGQVVSLPSRDKN
ncbi:polysaccharide biosynthesis protein [Dongshaea marina]|uniref:polysaccharide biosynthesis protein n=1 Tax=Dongshaea marina TaxID=2047966 RepID=UPI000D3E654D|nr:nucleoside-diphosphate sugar epimerase/dehydratase [Dongshaea marina]